MIVVPETNDPTGDVKFSENSVWGGENQHKERQVQHQLQALPIQKPVQEKEIVKLKLCRLGHHLHSNFPMRPQNYEFETNLQVLWKVIPDKKLTIRGILRPIP